MSLPELADEWDEPMPDEVRALLLQVLDARGYRIQSLAKAPPSDAVRSAPKRTTKKELSAHRVQRGVLVILLLGILQIGAGLLLGYFPGKSHTEQVALLEQLEGSESISLDGELVTVNEARVQLTLQRVLNAGLPIALGIFFLIVFHYAKERPLLGLWLALLVYALILVVEALFDPAAMGRGLFLKGMIVLGLSFGIVGARRLQNTRETEVSS